MDAATGAWRELIARLEPAAEFSSPVSEARLATAEVQLAIKFPAQIRSLLAETDGVLGAYGLGLVWPLDRIVSDNSEFRHHLAFRDYMSVDSMLFFGDGGDGEKFAHPITREGQVLGRVFVWNPIDDTRILVAESVRDYIQRWLDGRLKL